MYNAIMSHQKGVKPDEMTVKRTIMMISAHDYMDLTVPNFR